MLCVMALTGCYLPDNFEATISLRADGRVQISFDGELAYILGVAELFHGRMDPQAEELQAIAAAIKEDPRTRSVDYLGDGLYELSYLDSATLQPGQSLAFPPVGAPIFKIDRQRNGQLVLSGLQVLENDARALQRIGLRLRGQLTVITPLEIAEHNGIDDSGFMDNRYVWTFRSVKDERPRLVTKARSESDENRP